MSAHPTIFPYTNRSLSLQSHEVEKSSQLSPSQWAIIAMANLQPGDSVDMDGQWVVTQTNDEEIAFNLSGTDTMMTVPAKELTDHAIFFCITEKLTAVASDYAHPLCAVLERDPAVFRLRTQNGWVINDTLCKMTGNVRYPIQDMQVPEISEAEVPRTNTEKKNTKPAKKTIDSPQMGFDF